MYTSKKRFTEIEKKETNRMGPDTIKAVFIFVCRYVVSVQSHIVCTVQSHTNNRGRCFFCWLLLLCVCVCAWWWWFALLYMFHFTRWPPWTKVLYGCCLAVVILFGKNEKRSWHKYTNTHTHTQGATYTTHMRRWRRSWLWWHSGDGKNCGVVRLNEYDKRYSLKHLFHQFMRVSDTVK